MVFEVDYTPSGFIKDWVDSYLHSVVQIIKLPEISPANRQYLWILHMERTPLRLKIFGRISWFLLSVFERLRICSVFSDTTIISYSLRREIFNIY